MGKRTTHANTRERSRAIAQKLFELHESLQAFTVDELQSIDNDILQFDSTNCWHFEYDMKDVMRRIVGYVITEKVGTRRVAIERLGLKS